MKKIFVLTLVLLFSVVTLSAGNVYFKGLIQNWFSYADQAADNGSAMGFANKRVRFIPYGTLGKNIKWGFHVAFDKGATPNLFDAFIEYKFSNQFSLKMGKFAAPGAVSGALTPSGALDLVERAPITMVWAGGSALHGYRAFGVQAHGKLMDGKLYYALMLANPVANNIFLPSIKATSHKNDASGLGIWSRLEAKPMAGLRLGGFFGSSTATDTSSVEYKRSSYGAHLFYKKNGINFKLEYIGGDNGGIEYNGMVAVFGYKLNKKFEPIVRYDFMTPKDGGEKYTNFSIGLNYFAGKGIKYQVNYLLRNEELVDVANNIFYINFQYGFNSKSKKK